MTSPLDEEIVQGLVNEDNRAINELYKKYFKTISQFIVLNHGNEDDARDIFQDAVMVIFEKARNNKLLLSCSLKTYIYSVARNIWYKRNQTDKNLIEYVSTYNDDDLIEENIIDEEYREIIIKSQKRTLVYKVFRQLSKDCQKLIRLFLSGLSPDAVTKEMKYTSVQHTKNKRYRCKKSLITKLRRNPQYYELKDENYCANNELPRW